MLLAIVFTLSTQIFAQGWNGIVPLESNRDDVERILCRCKDGDKLSCLYKSKTENVVITYKSLAPCTDGTLNVAKGTVLSIAVFPQGGKKLDDLGMNFTSFVKEKDREIAGVWQFTNHEEGITIEAKNDFVIAIYYGPSKNAADEFRCKNPSGFF